MHEKKPIIIDTDPGDDDAASLLWILANPTCYDILGITVTNGNVGVDKCAINALRTIEIAGRSEIPVYLGAYRPLVRPSIEASWIHGKDGFGDLGFPLPQVAPSPGHAAVEMIRMAKESEHQVTILALGPLTNVAMAILLDNEFASHVKEIIFMGGAVRVSGNQAPRASYNVMVDPEAAKVIYNSGIPVVQVGLDVCDLVTQEVSDLDRISAAKTAVTDFLTRLLSFRREKAEKVIKDAAGKIVRTIKASEQVSGRKDGIGLNDLTATAYLIEPSWFKTMFVAADVAIGGICDGETVIDYKGLWGKEPNIHFAFDVSSRAVVERWISDMVAFKPR